VYRYDTQVEYDRRVPAASIYVSSDEGVRGIANCFPKVIHQQICPTAEEAISAFGK